VHLLRDSRFEPGLFYSFLSYRKPKVVLSPSPPWTSPRGLNARGLPPLSAFLNPRGDDTSQPLLRFLFNIPSIA